MYAKRIYEGANEFLGHFNLPCSNIIHVYILQKCPLHNLFVTEFYAEYSNTAEFINFYRMYI